MIAVQWGTRDHPSTGSGRTGGEWLLLRGMVDRTNGASGSGRAGGEWLRTNGGRQAPGTADGGQDERGAGGSGRIGGGWLGANSSWHEGWWTGRTGAGGVGGFGDFGVTVIAVQWGTRDHPSTGSGRTGGEWLLLRGMVDRTNGGEWLRMNEGRVARDERGAGGVGGFGDVGVTVIAVQWGTRDHPSTGSGRTGSGGSGRAGGGWTGRDGSLARRLALQHPVCHRPQRFGDGLDWRLRRCWRNCDCGAVGYARPSFDRLRTNGGEWLGSNRGRTALGTRDGGQDERGRVALAASEMLA